MSLFTRRRESAPVEERARISVPNGWFHLPGGLDMVSGANPLRSVAHWACRHVLASSIAGLPVQQIRETRTGRERITPSMVVSDPSGSVDQQAWVYQVMDSWLDAGNVYGDIVATDSRGFPAQVEVIAPAQVSWESTGAGVRPHVNGHARDVWPRGDLWHVAYIPVAGSPVGASPSTVAAQSAATSLAAEKFGGDFFSSSGHPTYDIEVAADITPEQAAAIKAGWLHSVRNREPWTHGNLIKATPMNVDPKASQFIELLQFECLQAARIYRVPPTMIYAAISGSSVTYANASQDDLAFLKHSLRWPIRRLQFAWSRFLPAPQVVRLNVDAFMEMTTMERAELHKVRLETKTRTVNEVRRIEDEDPFPGDEFDEPGVPGGMPGGPAQLQLPGVSDGGGA